MQIELKQVIDAVSKEKNMDQGLLVSALKEAVLTAAKKYYGDCIFETKYNEDSHEVELWRYRVVVKDDGHVNPLKEIVLSEALTMDESLQLGDEIGEALSTDQLGRIAAQAAKQAIVQKMVEAEKDKVIKEFKDKKNQLVVGQVRRFDKFDIIVDLGSCDGVIPVREQIPGEKYKLRDKVTCYILDVKKSSRGPQVILSRAHPEMLIRLFEQEVSEIAEGIVAIHSAARDPGSRSKIAVYSNEPSVDPVGACVGLKGVRVQAIVQELRGEKIDIIPYDRDPARFVCNGLAPAEVTKVIVNERVHMMEVVVPDEHLSLAIGKRGQNVRLAAQLTGWKVDIRSESKMRELMQDYRHALAQIPALGEMRAEILVNEGYKDPLDVSKMEIKTLCRLLRLTPDEATSVVEGAAQLAERAKNQDVVLDDVVNDMEELDVLATTYTDTALDTATVDEDDALKALMVKTKTPALLDPDKVDVKAIPYDKLSYWMKLKGVGESTAAVLVAAGFQDYEQLAEVSVEDIAHRTGLPFKFSSKIQMETGKLARA